MASSSRRARRNNRKNKQQSRSTTSQSSATDSQSTAPTYMVEENSQGELVNRRMGVAWPEKVYRVKRYPDYSSGQSLAASDSEDRFRTSPYEMVSIADLSEAIAAAKEARREKRAAEGRQSRTETETGSSPQYVRLSGRQSSEEEEEDWDTPTAQIDSVVFNTTEELDRYRRLFRAASLAQSATSLMSVKSAGARDETDRHYIGVRSRSSVDRKLKPGQFFIYYDKPSGAEMPVAIELKIGYMTSGNEIYHFPIRRFEAEGGEPYYAVMQTDMDVKMFDSMASLVEHYHAFSDGGDVKKWLGQPV